METGTPILKDGDRDWPFFEALGKSATADTRHPISITWRKLVAKKESFKMTALEWGVTAGRGLEIYLPAFTSGTVGQ